MTSTIAEVQEKNKEVHDRIKSLKYIPDHKLYKAVCTAIWNIVVKDFTLKGAINYSNYIYPNKAEIERRIKSVFPKVFFKKRGMKIFAATEKGQSILNTLREVRKLDEQFSKITSQ